MSICIDKYTINFNETSIAVTNFEKTWYAVINEDHHDFLLKTNVDSLNYILQIEEKYDKLLLKFISNVPEFAPLDCIELKQNLVNNKIIINEKFNKLVENKNLLKEYQLKIEKISIDMEILNKEYDLNSNKLENKKNEFISKMNELYSFNKNILDEFYCEYADLPKVLEVLTKEQLNKFYESNTLVKLINFKIDLKIFSQCQILKIYEYFSVLDLKKFIENIIDINIPINGENLLEIYCEKFDNPEFVQILLNKGVDIEGYKTQGKYNTALATALDKKNYKIAILLLDNNADVTMKGHCSANIHRDIPEEVCNKIIENAKKNNKLTRLKDWVGNFNSETLQKLIRNA